ncbi:retrovirus-related pol polyprotein from transposon TNT 1-94 [Tanacetum coccineum]
MISLHDTNTTTPPAAFNAQHTINKSGHSRGQAFTSRGNTSRGRGRGQGCQTPHCQLCRTNGHYASSCPNLSTYATRAASTDESLAQAFHAQCHVTTNNPDWHVDSGATDHMTPNFESLHHSTPYQGNEKVLFGDGKTLHISHKGSSTISNNIPLRNILVVPNLTKKLLSIRKLTSDYPVDVLFSQPFFHNEDRTTKRILASGNCENGLYVLKNEPCAFAATTTVSKKDSYELWHARLGHVSFDVISVLNKLGVLSITSLLPKPIICTPCQLAKGQRLSFNNNVKRSLHPLDLIHCDLWGPSPICSKDGYRYYVAFVDDCSRFTWLYPLKTKTGFYSVLPIFINLAQTQCSRKIKTFQSDGGTEFVNQTVRKILEDNGTFHRFSCLYTPQQNGRAERKHRHIVETGLAMLFNAHVPACYWVDAFTSATYIINRLPTPLLKNKSPFQLLFNQAPQYDNFRTFGCQVFPYLRDYAPHKLAPRSIPCIFIGYSAQHKGYRCLDPISSRIFVTRHARFNETIFPFSGSSCNTPISSLELTTFLQDIPSHTSSVLRNCQPMATKPTKSPSVCTLCKPPVQDSIQADDPLLVRDIVAVDESSSTQSIPSSHDQSSTDPITSNPNLAQAHLPTQTCNRVTESTSTPSTSNLPPSNTTTSSHPMTTRSKAGIFKPRHIADLASLTTHPLHVALTSISEPKGFKTAAKNPQWMAAMHEELQALEQNQTWTLVPRPHSTNIVGSKWVYRFKYKSDGTVDRYKDRLVAQGYTQIPGLDYCHTFSPVVKASTVRIVLSLAVLQKWKLHQLDVKNAFLNGNLNETVFMEQPPGFISHEFPNHVCKLSKALYGLKQAPRVWFHRLSTFLVSYGFTSSRADTSLFVYTDHGLFLTQSKYASDILKRADLYDSKPVSTPLAPHVSFTANGLSFSDPTLYRSLVGALQYLTITRPDLSYAVNQVSQFLHAPTIDHFQSLKRILRYVKGTISFGLTFSRPHKNSIVGYSDADWITTSSENLLAPENSTQNSFQPIFR